MMNAVPEPVWYVETDTAAKKIIAKRLSIDPGPENWVVCTDGKSRDLLPCDLPFASRLERDRRDIGLHIRFFVNRGDGVRPAGRIRMPVMRGNRLARTVLHM
jgi:hypothetical protein